MYKTVFLTQLILIVDDTEVLLDEGEIRITTEGVVKFPKELERIISPDLDKKPNTALCSTTFVSTQVSLSCIY